MKTIAERTLEGIEMDLRSEAPKIVPRHAFLREAQAAIIDKRITSEDIARVAERQNILRGGTAKQAHRVPPILRMIRYTDAALALVICS